MKEDLDSIRKDEWPKVIIEKQKNKHATVYRISINKHKLAKANMEAN